MSRQYKFRASSAILIAVLVISLFTATETPLLYGLFSAVTSQIQDHGIYPLSTKEILWEKTYGGAGDDRAFCIIPANNKGFLIAGSSRSFNSDHTDAWVVCIDPNGDSVWNKTFIKNEDSEFRNVLSTTDGFLLVGNTIYSSGEEDAWIVKVDREGKIMWSKTFGGKGLNKIFSAAEASDGYVLAGFADSPETGRSRAWLTKTDIDGNLLWNKTYDGSGNCAFRSILVSANGDLVMAGYCSSLGDGNYDFWLVKTDRNGIIAWNKTFGGLESEKAYALATSPDGYVLVGEIDSGRQADAYVVKTDHDGRFVWSNAYGGADFDVANVIVPTSNGGYVVAGFTFSYGEGQRDFWFFEIDDVGNLIWSRTYGKEGFEEAYAAVEVGRNGFAIAGWTNSIGAGSYDFCVIKADIVVSSDILDHGTAGYLCLAFFGISAILSLICLYSDKKEKDQFSKLAARQTRGLLALGGHTDFLCNLLSFT